MEKKPQLTLHAEHMRPAALRVDASGAFRLDNLMSVWGRAQGLCESEIVDALREHMFHKDKTSLRFAHRVRREGA